MLPHSRPEHPRGHACTDQPPLRWFEGLGKRRAHVLRAPFLITPSGLTWARRRPCFRVGPAVSQHVETETGCALEGRAVWPGLLEPPYLMGPSHSTLRVSGLRPGHSSWGVDTGMGDRWRENRNKPMKPGQRPRDLEDGQGTHDGQAERLGARDTGAGPPGRGPGTGRGGQAMPGLSCVFRRTHFPAGLARGHLLDPKGCGGLRVQVLSVLPSQVVTLPRTLRGTESRGWERDVPGGQGRPGAGAVSFVLPKAWPQGNQRGVLRRARVTDTTGTTCKRCVK